MGQTLKSHEFNADEKVNLWTVNQPKCRHCNAELNHVFVDLVNAPLSNELVRPDQLENPSVYYPLKIYVCDNCFLVQTGEKSKPEEIFNSDYPYFSSYSKSWLRHAREYVDMMMEKFHYDQDSLVVEIASNDGYLLQYFKEYNVPVLGVEPTTNTAEVALSKGINSINDFFGVKLVKSHFRVHDIKADLIIGNNVLAHVPDINDFVTGMKMILKDDGIITMEFPHLLKLIKKSEFDTIYHEHFSYFSFTAVNGIFSRLGLNIFDVEEIPTHGGSLRIYARHAASNHRPVGAHVKYLLDKETRIGISDINYYLHFQEKVDRIRYEVLKFLIHKKSKGKKVIGYGAAAKGNTLLNYCGLKGNDLINFVVDASPHKQNKYLPGSQIPIYSKEKIYEYKPDYIIILPWNLKDEIMDDLSFVRDWGCRFVVFIPKLTIY